MNSDFDFPVIGFDAKRAAQNSTGLGNYSRLVIEALSCHADDILCKETIDGGKADTAPTRLCLYMPDPRRTDMLGRLPSLQGVELKFPRRRPWRWLRALWRVWGVTADVVADGVGIYHGLSGELPLNIERARGVKSVVTVHDLIFLRYPQLYKPIDRWIYTYKFRRACNVADRIIAISECTKRDIMSHFGIPAEKIDVVYQGCDPAYAIPSGTEKRAEVRDRYALPSRYVLYVGSIEARKNLILLAKALPLLRDKDVKVIAVGRRTAEAERIDAFVDANGLRDRFRMIHGVPFADLPTLYQMAEVFVYPSRFEGFGIPMLEAVTSGTPAIGCTGSCLEEAGGPSSLYVHPDDAGALAAAIDSVLSDETLRHKMIAAGHAWAARFSTRQMAADLLKVYSRV